MIKTNFVLIEFNSQKFTVFVDKYSDENHLKELRAQYGDTHAFFRHYGTEIIVLPMVKDAIEIGKERTIDVNRDYKLISRFVQEVVFRQIKTVGNTPNRYRPISLISRATKDDLIFDIVQSEYKGRIGYKKGYEIESRVFCPEGEPIFGLVINTYYRWLLNITCGELVNKKIDIVGKYVCEDIMQNNKELAPKRQLVGEVKDVKDDMAVIQSRDGLITKDLSVIFPENSYENREYFIKKLLGENVYSKVIREIVSTSGQRKSTRAQFESIDWLLNNWFTKQIFTNNNGFSFKVNNYYDNNNGYWVQSSLQKPSFIFDLHESKTDTNQDKGLRNYGPYDSGFFDRKVPNIAVICRATSRGTVTDFLSKFENGIPSISFSWGQPYGQGFVRKYKLNNIHWHIFEVQSDNIPDYERTIRECLDSNIDWDLAIVETTENYMKLPNASNPYYFTKAKLMSNNIPVQEIKIENMTKDDGTLVYILNNISLACYAKMGGIPWVIPSSKKIDIELVIGIGSTIIKKNRFDLERRIVGLTTIFSSDGKYLLSNKSKDVAFQEYFDELLKSLKSAIEEIKKREGWQKGECY